MLSDRFHEVDVEQYQRYSPQRKVIIVAVLSFCASLAQMSSTSILPAITEVAETYYTTSSVINASNAVYLAFMGFSAPFWGLSARYGAIVRLGPLSNILLSLGMLTIHARSC